MSVLFSVGKKNPCELPQLDANSINIGSLIMQGGVGVVYHVEDSNPPRVYKIIKTDRVYNGDEIKISQIASDIKVSPRFHRAFVVAENETKYVFIEMDYAGKSLKKCMEGFIMEEAIDNIYDKKRELFYQNLFQKIKSLNEKCIAYKDIHVGNIMFTNEDNGEIQLIDFDEAKLTENITKAVRKSYSSPFFKLHYKAFKNIPHLSPESHDLIQWFLRA